MAAAERNALLWLVFCIGARAVIVLDPEKHGQVLLAKADSCHSPTEVYDVAAICKRWENVSWGKCPKENIHNLCDDEPQFCKGGKHKRCEMPQFPDYSGHVSGTDLNDNKETKNTSMTEWEQFIAHLKHKDIEVDVKRGLTVEELISFGPSQNQLDACKVCEILGDARKCGLKEHAVTPAKTCMDREHNNGCFCSWAAGIHVADLSHRILDGHHRWAVTKLLAGDETSFASAEDRAAFRAQTVYVLSYNATEDQIRLTTPPDAKLSCGTYDDKGASRRRRRRKHHADGAKAADAEADADDESEDEPEDPIVAKANADFFAKFPDVAEKAKQDGMLTTAAAGPTALPEQHSGGCRASWALGSRFAAFLFLVSSLL